MNPENAILLVENDKEYLYRLEQSFRKVNIPNPLKVARYGNEAILYLKGVGIYGDRRTYPLPGLILLDVTNPDGSALALLGWIREQDCFAMLPIVLLTGPEQNGTLQKTLERGANAYLLKREELQTLANFITSLHLPLTDSANKAGLLSAGRP